MNEILWNIQLNLIKFLISFQIIWIFLSFKIIILLFKELSFLLLLINSLLFLFLRISCLKNSNILFFFLSGTLKLFIVYHLSIYWILIDFNILSYPGKSRNYIDVNKLFKREMHLIRCWNVFLLFGNYCCHRSCPFVEQYPVTHLHSRLLAFEG